MKPAGLLRLLGGLLAAGILNSGAAPAAEREIYTWVDAQGVTHFSDALPKGEPKTLQRMQLEPAPPPTAPEESRDRYSSLLEQAERMSQDRREWERVRNERRLAEQQARDAQRGPPRAGPAHRTYVPVYPLYPAYPIRPRPPGIHPPGPHPPVEPPPAQQPPHSVLLPGRIAR